MSERIRRLAVLACAAAALLLGSCRSAVGSAASAGVAVEPTLVDPAQNSAIHPVPRDGRWMERHEGFLAEAKAGGINVLFLGDSITDRWRERDPARGGRAVWDREFAPLGAANFGISADRTQHVLWRVKQGEVDGIHPKVVVLLIGTNNTGLESDRVTPRNSPEQAAEGVKAIVRELRARLPEARILLLGVFPRGERPDHPQRIQVSEINRLIAPLGAMKNVRYLDLTETFLRPDGTLSKDIMPDYLHPGEKGYEIWAREMKPVLLELLR